MSPSDLWELIKNGGITVVVLIVLYLITQGFLVVGGSHKEQMKILQEQVAALTTQIANERKEKDTELEQVRRDKELEIARLLDRNSELWELIKLSRGLVQISKETAGRAVGDAERALLMINGESTKGGEH